MKNVVTGAESDSTIRAMWRYQPMVPAAVALAGGIALDRLLSLPMLAWIAVSIVLIGAWCVVSRAWSGLPAEWPGSIVVLLVIAAVGGAWHHVYWRVFPADDIGHWCTRAGQPVRVRGVCAEEPLIIPADPQDALRAFPEQTRSVCQIEVYAIQSTDGWTRASGKARLVVNGELTTRHAGDSVEVLGEVIAPPPAANPGEFDYANYLRGRRTRALIHCDEPAAVLEAEPIPGMNTRRWIARVAGVCEQRLVARLPEGQREIAVALLLGRYELLEEEVTERYMRTGTMHILAISGQHLAVLAWFLWLLLRFVPIPRKWGALILATLVVGYALLTGARPPVLRAAVLVCVFVGAIVIGARSRKANPLALALLIVLSVNPADLFDRGLQLSFLAVAALSWIVEPIRHWLNEAPPQDPIEDLFVRPRPWWQRGLRWIGSWILIATLMSAVVWLANVPLLAARFNLFSPIVVPLTVVLVPLATFSLITGLALLVIDPWWTAAGTVLAKLCGGGILAMDWTVKHSLAVPFGHAYVPGPPEWWVTGFYIGLTGILLFVRPFGRWRWACGSLSAAWVSAGFATSAFRPPPERLECQILAVGNGSAAVLHLPSGRTVLVDAGQIAGPRVGGRLIAPALWSAGVRRIDAVFVSHADVDHFNGLPQILDRFSIGQVFIPPHFAASTQPGAQLVCDRLADKGIADRLCFAGQELDFGGGVRARVLHPPLEFDGTDNEQSAVLLVEYLGRRILLTGDLEGAGLRRLLATEPLSLDVLIAPHHGSRRANTPELVAWAQPKLVIVSQGKPRSGASLDAFHRAGVRVMSTNEYGAITVRIDSRGLEVRTIQPGDSDSTE